MRWPRANSASSDVAGILRSSCDDFEVTESLGFDLSGVGEHLYVYATKRDVTTREVQRLLASACEVPLNDVSYAGMKDKRAIAHQWFSVRRPARETITLDERVSVLHCGYHATKLRRGELNSNQFRIRIRNITGDVQANLEVVKRRGVPNYFGAQRFGFKNRNVTAARKWISSGRSRIPRFTRSIYISSLRSFLFNEVLGARVANDTWQRVLTAEASIDGAPTGPLWGRGRLPGAGVARDIEMEALKGHGEITDALEFVGLVQERRLLMAVPRDMTWSMTMDALTLDFTLDKGTYATSVLREVGEFREPNEPAVAKHDE